jgi:hypothetical protein
MGWLAPRPGRFIPVKETRLKTAAENLAPTGIRCPDRPARSELLYRLSCPGPLHPFVVV